MAAIRQADTPDDLEAIRELFAEYAASLGIDLGFQDFATEVRTLPGALCSPHGTSPAGTGGPGGGGLRGAADAGARRLRDEAAVCPSRVPRAPAGPGAGESRGR